MTGSPAHGSAAARRTVALLGAVVAVLLALTACGVPLESSARPLPSDALPTFGPQPTPTETPEPMTTARLWFVREDGLVPYDGPVMGTEPQQLLDALAMTPADRPELRTLVLDPLTGTPFLVVVPTEPFVEGRVTVQADSAFNALPSGEQVLLLGQVVLTLTTRMGIYEVLVVNEAGEPLAVPLPDGRLLDGPATSSDYRALVRRP